ncbi:MAG: restriction endonuclease [Acidimicrobiia bacterium]
MGFSPPIARALREALNAAFYRRSSLADWVGDWFAGDAIVDSLLNQLRSSGGLTKREFSQQLVQHITTQRGDLAERALEAARELSRERRFDDLRETGNFDGVPLAIEKARSLEVALSAGRDEARSIAAPVGVKEVPDVLLADELVDAFSELRDREPHDRGRQLEKWLVDALLWSGLEASGGYDTKKGEQIDGFFVLNGVHWIIEAKWLKSTVPPSEVDTFVAKIGRRPLAAGLLVSYSGFSDNALRLYSERGHQLIGVVGEDLEQVLSRRVGLRKLIERKITAAVRTGLFCPRLQF